MANKQVPTLQPGSLEGNLPRGIGGREPDLSAEFRQIHGAAAAFEGFGRAAKDVMTTAFDIVAQKRKIADRVELGNLAAQQEAEFLQWRNEFNQGNPDPSTYADTVSKQYDKITQKIAKGATSQNVRDEFAIRSNQRKMEITGEAYREENKRFIDVNTAEKIRQVEIFKKLGVEAQTEEESQSHFNTMLQIIRDGEQTGLIPHSHAMAMEIQNKAEFEAKRKAFTIARSEKQIFNDPLGAIYQLETESGGEFGHHDEPTRTKLLDYARRIQKLKETEQEHEQAKAVKEANQKEGNEMFALYVNPRVGIDEFLAQISTKQNLTWEQKRMLTDMKEAKIKNVNAVTDFRTYMKIKESIVNDATLDQTKSAILTNESKLSESDREGLFNFGLQKVEIQDKENRKRGYEIIKDQIYSGKDLMGGKFPKTQEEAINFYQATNQFDDLLNQAKKKGKTLNANDVTTEAFMISNSKKKTPIQTLKDRANALTGPKNKKGETIEEYENKKKENPKVKVPSPM